MRPATQARIQYSTAEGKDPRLVEPPLLMMLEHSLDSSIIGTRKSGFYGFWSSMKITLIEISIVF